MDDPIKIIWKFKNENKKEQYHVCIAVGNILSPAIKKILKKIKDLNLFDTLISVSDTEYANMEKKYGIYWPKNLFTRGFFYINRFFIKDFILELSNKYKQDENKRSIS